MRGVHNLQRLAGADASMTRASAVVSSGMASAVVFLDDGGFQWTVPAGVNSVSILCVGGGQYDFNGIAPGYDTFVKRGLSTLCFAPGGGGDPALVVGDGFYATPDETPRYSADTIPVTKDPFGNYSGSHSVTLFGEASNGMVRTTPGGYLYNRGDTDRDYYLTGGLPGGAAKPSWLGGIMAWVNEIPVTPGEILDLTLAAAGYSSPGGTNQYHYFGGLGGVVFCWGAGGYPRLHTVPQDVTYV
jgi:hypothetical protein